MDLITWTNCPLIHIGWHWTPVDLYTRTARRRCSTFSTYRGSTPPCAMRTSNKGSITFANLLGHCAHCLAIWERFEPFICALFIFRAFGYNSSSLFGSYRATFCIISVIQGPLVHLYTREHSRGGIPPINGTGADCWAKPLISYSVSIRGTYSTYTWRMRIRFLPVHREVHYY